MSSNIPSWDDLHPFTRLALHMNEPFSLLLLVDVERSSNLRACYIFTDGSCVDGNASWGYCVVLKFRGEEDTFRFTGSSAGEVILDTSHPLYLGASSCTNYSGELCALAHALIFVLQFHVIHHIDI